MNKLSQFLWPRKSGHDLARYFIRLQSGINEAAVLSGTPLREGSLLSSCDCLQFLLGNRAEGLHSC